MVDNVAMTRLMFDIFDFERKKLGNAELVSKLAEEVRTIFGVDSAAAKLLSSSSLLPSEEFAANTMNPYIDNRLSEYSAFKELVDGYKAGYRSYATVPLLSNGKSFGVLSLMSKDENRFDSSMMNALQITSTIIGYQVSARMEYEKSVNLARYFDAAFNSITPQFLIDSDGNVVKANKSMLMLFGASTRDVNGRNVKDLFEIDSNMLSSLKRGIVAETRAKGKENRIFKISSSSISDKLMHVTFYETTDLKELEERTKILKYSNYEAMLMMDAKTNIIWASENCDRVLRVHKEALLGRPLIGMVLDKDRAREGIGGISDNVYTDSMRIDIGNGAYVDVRASVFKNGLYGFSCIMANNALEGRYKNIERNFDELVKLSGDAVLFVDQLGYVQRMNKSAESLLGFREQEISGSPLSALYSNQEEQDRMNRAIAIAKQEGSISSIFATLKGRGDDALIPCEQSMRILTDDNGNLSGYVVVCKELRTKRSLDEAQDMLMQRDRQITNLTEESDLKTQFINNISHDLKTPLTNIKGFATILNNEEHGAMNEEQKEYTNIIMNEAERLMSLIQQILDVAKLSSGKVKLDLQPVDMRKLGENPSIKALEEVAAGNGLIFSWNVDYNVGEIKIDPNRIIQVFVNLINNAIKFTEHGSISVSIFRKGKSVRVEVKDTGLGISKEDQKKLFRKFYQVQRKDLTVQQGSGTGLGLSIVKEIVNLHGGKMGVVSELGKGSTFWFTIPIEGKQKKKSAQQKSQQAAA
ncbi:MAG: PAS domain-containing protein [Candidatus Micrarchaeota archaeon]|nr:PAS domain-containing protein [Candidatus Micrarchaeota archaeon]MDE1804664.1 PAS domain-containing protein [Candidatus Micrarchaeota archaeon]MDE1846870.1 PAS domain-containing protein [Candidatus Micrarchaeota archaeon]